MGRLIVFFLLLGSTPALATVYVPVDFREMVTASHAIVRGRVIDVRSELTPGRTRIASYVTIEVDEHLKGAFGQEVTFRIPGGQVGRYRRIIVGAPQFTRGDEVILFLSGRGPSLPYVFGLSQGVYRIVRGADGRPVVTPSPILARGPEAERVVRGDPARRPLPLDAFTREVKTILETAK